jgi:hypothetical protein
MSAGGNKLLGVDFLSADTSAKHELGGCVLHKDGTVYVYAKASAAVAAGDPVKVTAASISNGAVTFTVAPSGNAGVIFGVSPIALAQNEFGWIAVQGLVKVKAATGLAAGVTFGLVTNATGQIVAGGDTGDAQTRRGVTGSAEASNLAYVVLF